MGENDKKNSRRNGIFFVKRGVIEKEDKDVYIYGSELLISEIICTLLVIGISLCTGEFIETLIYLFSYMSIRVYAGGYHASSYSNCITIFNLCYVGVMYVMKIIQLLGLLKILELITFGAIMIIWKLAPVEDLRKPLDEEERYIYRKKARKKVLLLFLFAIIVTRIFPTLKDKVYYGLIAICEIALLLLVGYIKNRRLIYYRKTIRVKGVR